MRRLFVFLLLLSASSYVYAFWSSYAYVSSVIESEFNLTVSVVHVSEGNGSYLVRLKAVAYPYKQAWVITTLQSIPPNEQNQRARFWGKELSLFGVESIIPLRPTERPLPLADEARPSAALSRLPASPRTNFKRNSSSMPSSATCRAKLNVAL